MKSLDIFYNGVTDAEGRIIYPGFKHLIKAYVRDFDIHYKFSAITIRYPNGNLEKDKMPSVFQVLFLTNRLVNYEISERGRIVNILMLKTHDNVAVSTGIRNLIITSERYKKYLFHMSSWTNYSIFSLLKVDLGNLLNKLQELLRIINNCEDLKYAINQSLKVKYGREKRRIEDIDFKFWIHMDKKINTVLQAVLALFSIHRRYYGAIFETIEKSRRFSSSFMNKDVDPRILRDWINRVMIAWQYDIDLLIMSLRNVIQKIFSDRSNRIIINRLRILISLPLHYTLVQKDLRKISRIVENEHWKRIMNEYDRDMLRAGINEPKINLFLMKIWFYLKYKSCNISGYPHLLILKIDTLKEPGTLDNTWRQSLPEKFREDRRKALELILEQN